MEPFPKRQRLYAPLARGLESPHAYYEDFPESGLAEFEDVEDEEDEEDDEDLDEDEEEEEEEEVSDPEADLQQRRARLDYKLKSTFEAIFEKYGKDFDGVGDEIDLETGDIVVDNGHILDMHNERDAGDTRHSGRLLRELSDELEDFPTSSVEETEILDEDEDEDEDEENERDELMSDEEMLEDDMILRGFAKANRFAQPSPELGHPARQEKSHDPWVRPGSQSHMMPKVAEIMAQFGPQVGPQILEYIAQQQAPIDNHDSVAWRVPKIYFKQAPDVRHVEPLWRAPELPTALSDRRPKVKSTYLEPEVERSPSPEMSASIWAPVRPRGRRRVDGADSAALFRGESKKPYRPPQPSDPFNRWSASALGPHVAFPHSERKRERRDFTVEEDEILLEWVDEARRRGLELWSDGLWKELEAEYPRHSYISWRIHYKRKFTYLLSEQSDHAGESESQASDESTGAMVYQPNIVPQAKSNLKSIDERPTRVRKPVQKDSRIISWSDAVDVIKSLDPDLHAGLIEDARTVTGSRWKTDNPISASGQDLRFSRKSSQLNPGSSSSMEKLDGHLPGGEHSHRGPQRSYLDSSDNAEHQMSESMAVQATPDQDDIAIPSVPCQHTDCRNYPTVSYRLQRRDGESLSEMCLHLFRVHHTTPFPCGEVNCLRKGEEGFFIQTDLVKHVRTSHPSIGALYRLRGRVETELLDRNIDIARLGNPSSVFHSNRELSQQKDSEFTSPRMDVRRRGSQSSRPLSSRYEPDRTSTPGYPTRMPGVSTPMTSVSSLRVHHSSANAKPLQSMNSNQDMYESRQSGESSSPRGISKSDDKRPYGLPTPFTSVGGSLSAPLVLEDPQMLSRPMIDLDVMAQQRKIAEKSSFSRLNDSQKPSRCSSIPNSQSPRDESHHFSTPDLTRVLAASTTSQQLQTHGPPLVTASITDLERPQVNEPSLLNTFDPAYEFSDEEMGIEPPVLQTNLLPTSANQDIEKPVQHHLSPSIAERVSQSATKPASNSTTARRKVGLFPPNTPLPTVVKVKGTQNDIQPLPTTSGKRKAPKSVQRKVYDSDDLDELSLGADDFILLSSHVKKNLQPSFMTRVKQEEGIDSPQSRIFAAAAKKRKLNMYQRTDEVDELAEFSTISNHPTSSSTKIKKEVDQDEVPILRSKHKSTKQRLSLSLLGSPRSRHKDEGIPSRTGTPFLDFTLGQQGNEGTEAREIVDSTAPSSSVVQRETSSELGQAHEDRQAETASPLVGLLTPARDKRWTDDALMAEQVKIVIKTPGGTLRRCGEDGFSCGRSFCFRCGTSEVAVSK